jgi:hypothetical protein
MKKLVASLAFALVASAAWALPTVQQVEIEVQQGHTERAEGMMSEVVAAKPGSARAHYVYAEILARNGKFAKASEEEAKARQIDPNASFASPDRVQAFEQLLDREQRAASRTAQAPMTSGAQAPMTNSGMAPLRTAAPSPGIPSWLWLAMLAAVAFFLWRGFSRSRAAAAGAWPGAGGVPAPGYGPMNPGAPYGPGVSGASSGLLGTGLAVAGGVAGGMLLDEMLHRRNDPGFDRGGNGLFGSGGSDALQGNDAATELETRQVDFGNGNDWDSGGGSADLGGGGDGGSWDS